MTERKINSITVIVDGGLPLEGCPKDWDEARLIEKKLNNGLDENESQPTWKFDCGFKLDYDGGLLRINSRFYPPKTHYGSTWDGTMSVYILDKNVAEKKFDCATLDELHLQVKEYVETIIIKLTNLFNPNP